MFIKNVNKNLLAKFYTIWIKLLFIGVIYYNVMLPMVAWTVLPSKPVAFLLLERSSLLNFIFEQSKKKLVRLSLALNAYSRKITKFLTTILR